MRGRCGLRAGGRGYTQLMGPLAKQTLTERMNVGVSRQDAGHAAEGEGEFAAALDKAGGALGWTHPLLQRCAITSPTAGWICAT
jgi:hypothetical protein